MKHVMRGCCCALLMCLGTHAGEVYWDFEGTELPPGWSGGAFRVVDGKLTTRNPGDPGFPATPGSTVTPSFRYMAPTSTAVAGMGFGSGDDAMIISGSGYSCSDAADNCYIELLRIDHNYEPVEIILTGDYFGPFSVTLPFSVIDPEGFYTLRITAYDFDDPSILVSLDDLRITNAVLDDWDHVPADMNFNGSVDAADYVLWRKNLFEIVEVFRDGDANGNSFVNAADYEVWRRDFGKSLSNTGSASTIAGRISVPEPCASMLVAVVVFLSLRLNRSQRIFNVP